MRRQRALLLAGLLAALTACAGPERPRVWVPPRIDLHAYGTLGLVDFASPKTDPLASRRDSDHGTFARQQFLAAVHAAQAGVPVLELGSRESLLRTVRQDAMGPDAARAIGEHYGVDVLVLGDLALESPRPGFSIESMAHASASAELLGTLHVRFLDTRNGATIWSQQVRGTRTVARVDLLAGARPRIDAVDPDGESARLVTWLVGRATEDFRGSWTQP